MTPANQRKAAERARYKAAGLVAVTVWVPPSARELLRRYVHRLVQRHQPGRDSPTGQSAQGSTDGRL